MSYTPGLQDRHSFMSDRHASRNEPEPPPKYGEFNLEDHGSSDLREAMQIPEGVLSEDELASIHELLHWEREMHPLPCEVDRILNIHPVPDEYDDDEDERPLRHPLRGRA